MEQIRLIENKLMRNDAYYRTFIDKLRDVLLIMGKQNITEYTYNFPYTKESYFRVTTDKNGEKIFSFMIQEQERKIILDEREELDIFLKENHLEFAPVVPDSFTKIILNLKENQIIDFGLNMSLLCEKIAEDKIYLKQIFCGKPYDISLSDFENNTIYIIDKSNPDMFLIQYFWANSYSKLSGTANYAIREKKDHSNVIKEIEDSVSDNKSKIVHFGPILFKIKKENHSYLWRTKSNQVIDKKRIEEIYDWFLYSYIDVQIINYNSFLYRDLAYCDIIHIYHQITRETKEFLQTDRDELIERMYECPLLFTHYSVLLLGFQEDKDHNFNAVGFTVKPNYEGEVYRNEYYRDNPYFEKIPDRTGELQPYYFRFAFEPHTFIIDDIKTIEVIPEEEFHKFVNQKQYPIRIEIELTKEEMTNSIKKEYPEKGKSEIEFILTKYGYGEKPQRIDKKEQKKENEALEKFLDEFLTGVELE